MDQEDFNTIAWRDFMHWALSDPDMRRAFETATGRPFNDSAPYVVAFTKWATLNHYGIEYAPKAYRDALTESVS